MRISPAESIQIVSQALGGIAKDWWYVYESNVREYTQFKDLFKDGFWNSTIQRQTRRKVEFGTFYAGGKLDRRTYATTRFGYAKELGLACSIRTQLKNDTTIWSKHYQVPSHYKEKEKKERNKMMILGIIKPSKNNYTKSMLPVIKTKNPLILILGLTSQDWKSSLLHKNIQYNVWINRMWNLI